MRRISVSAAVAWLISDALLANAFGRRMRKPCLIKTHESILPSIVRNRCAQLFRVAPHSVANEFCAQSQFRQRVYRPRKLPPDWPACWHDWRFHSRCGSDAVRTAAFSTAPRASRDNPRNRCCPWPHQLTEKLTAVDCARRSRSPSRRAHSWRNVALIFSDGRRMRHGMWLAVASGLWGIAVYALVVETGRRGGAVGSDALLSFPVNSRRAGPNRYPTCRNGQLRPTQEIHSA